MIILSVTEYAFQRHCRFSLGNTEAVCAPQLNADGDGQKQEPAKSFLGHCLLKGGMGLKYII